MASSTIWLGIHVDDVWGQHQRVREQQIATGKENSGTAIHTPISEYYPLSDTVARQVGWTKYWLGRGSSADLLQDLFPSHLCNFKFPIIWGTKNPVASISIPNQMRWNSLHPLPVQHLRQLRLVSHWLGLLAALAWAILPRAVDGN